ncbi:LOW QUALITY PROTEIN: hypothetical protein YC2023_110351 [Brassica napus]
MDRDEECKKLVPFNFADFCSYLLRQHATSPVIDFDGSMQCLQCSLRDHLLLFKLQLHDGLLLQPPPTLCSITRKQVPPTPLSRHHRRDLRPSPPTPPSFEFSQS